MVAAALWAWATGRPVLTGVLIGLGAATKLYPLFLLGGLLVICLRDKRIRDFGTGHRRGGGRVGGGQRAGVRHRQGAVEGLLVVQLRPRRRPRLDLAGDLAGLDEVIDASTINSWSWAFFGLWCLGVLVLGLRAPETPRLAQLGFLIVAGFLLVNKVYSPQYVLWLLPLAALARPRWRDQLIWQGGEILYFAAVWWYLGGYLAPAGGADAGFYWVAIVVRMLVELYLVAIVARDIWWPEHDPVRESERERDAGQVTTMRSNPVVV